MAQSGHLKLVTDHAAKPKREYLGKPLECVCGSRATIEVRLDRRQKCDNITKGQKQLRCADCGAVVWA